MPTRSAKTPTLGTLGTIRSIARTSSADSGLRGDDMTVRSFAAQRGQTLALFALIMAFVVIPAVGLVVDGGYALGQRREAQNASDFAALAGARIVAEKVANDTTNGTDANVQAAITNSIAVNKGSPVTFWTSTSKDANNNPCTATPTGQPGCDFPYYVNSSGAFAGYVGAAAAIPSGSAGVRLNASRKWTPFFVGGIVGNWTATATATAMGGYAAGGPGGNVFPVGIAQAFFTGRQPCSGSSPATTNVNGSGTCDPQHLTPGSLNVPGGFGWLKFGCSGDGLGQGSDGGCANSKPFLQSEIGTGSPRGRPIVTAAAPRSARATALT